MTDRGTAGAYNNIVKNIKTTKTSAGYNSQPKQNILKTLKCVFCLKDKPLDSFSETMISKATHNLYAPPSFNVKKKPISCKGCTSTSNTHLTCMICGRRLPLSKFANKQRRNHDKARCKKCIEKRQEEDVWSDNDDTDSADDDF